MADTQIFTGYAQGDGESDDAYQTRRERERTEAEARTKQTIRTSPPYRHLINAIKKGNGNTLTTLLLVKNLKSFSYDVTEAIDLLLEDTASS